MSELTPEQWRELDAAERELAAFNGDIMRAGWAAKWNRLDGLLYEHARTLIDAARPRCEGCNGHGATEMFRICPDCYGRGWAA